MLEPASLGAHLDNVLTDATIPELPNHYRGKVRDNYDLPDGRRIIIATDRLSAFDRIFMCVPSQGPGSEADPPVLVRCDELHLPEPRHRLSGPERSHLSTARHPAGRNRR